MKNVLIITTYNRPRYLEKCLQSLQTADLFLLDHIIIVDDASTDKDTRLMVYEFDRPGVSVDRIMKRIRAGIKDSLLLGYEAAMAKGDVQYIINIDGDAVVSRDFLTVLIGLKERHETQIVCGFNTLIKNRNPIIKHHADHYEKKYASGINMVITLNQYWNYIFPALKMPVGNWDFEASKLHMADGKSVIVAKPSVVQHIGIEESSMGHITAAEPPDVAQDFKLMTLKDVTLIGVDCLNIDRLIRAANECMRDIRFADVKLLSSIPSADPRVVPIAGQITSKEQYSWFMLKHLNEHVHTDYMLVIQHDGYIKNPLAWSDKWYEYDYVGAPWMWYSDDHKVGNGGFSFRSRKLHEITANDAAIVPTNQEGINYYMEEDHTICRVFRKYLEGSYQIKFAPLEEAMKFSIEAWKEQDRNYNGEFGFHGGNVLF